MWVLSGFCKLKVARNCKPKKKSSLGASVALAGALEQQAIGSEIRIEELDSEGSLLEKSESDCHLHLDRIKSSDDNNDVAEEQEIKVTEDVDSEEKNGEEKNGRVDVRELASSIRFAKMADDMDEVLKDKGELPPPVYSTMIRGLGREKLPDPAFALFEWLKRKKKETYALISKNPFIYNSLSATVKQSEQFGEMEKVLNDMVEEGVVPNIVTYNTMMAIYLENGADTKAPGVLEEMHKKGLTPSPVSYSTALLAFWRMEDGHGAIKFFVNSRENYRKGEIGEGDEDEDWENEFVMLENFTIRVCYQVMRHWLVNEDNLGSNVLKLRYKTSYRNVYCRETTWSIRTRTVAPP